MRLGVDAWNLAADHRGMGRVVRSTLARLQKSGITPELIVREEGDEPALQDEFSSLPVLTSAAVREAKFDAVWYPWNAMRFKPHAFSIVSIHDPFAFTFAHPNVVARFREQAPVRRALRKADRIFAVSHWTASELQRLFGLGPPRVQVVLNEVDPFWRPAGTAQTKPYFFFLGGTDERKNASMLFSAYDAAFGGGGPELVVGGSLNEADEQAFDEMRAPRRRVKPNDEELRALYSGALAVLVPSLAEGFGLPAVEAMACGAPVIASTGGALPETCADAALLVNPVDEQAWADELRRIADDPELRAQLQTRGFKRAAEAGENDFVQALVAALAERR